jgi:hypothetical protein
MAMRLIARVRQLVWDHLIGRGTATKDLNYG